MSEPLLEVEALSVRYPVAGGGLFRREKLSVKAVESVSFTLAAGETLGIVGETGCGKSSLGRAVLQLVAPTAGRVIWMGQDLCQLKDADLKPLRADLQLIFQDPLSSLNPRMTIGEIIAEPLALHHPGLSRDERAVRVDAMMERVGLAPAMAARYPSEFSGGQCQRVSIARAMIVEPKLLVCDEPVSALDVSVQAQVCNLLKKLQRDTGVAIVFISHDLSVVRYMSQRILVMYLGQVMEIAPRDALFGAARHPYTQALISAIPLPDPAAERNKALIELEGELPSPMHPPTGCVFSTRCPKAIPVCNRRRPEVAQAGQGHDVFCHRWDEP